MAETPVLRVEGLSKTFGGTQALRGVTLEIRADEIHALVGQNGSGKSTLVKILAGFHHADPGAKAWLDGEPFDPAAITDARHDRLRFVHQDLGLVLELSAMENLALSRGFQRHRFGRVHWSEQARTTREVFARFGVEIDINRPLSAATPVERTIVAIAAALQGWQGGRGVLVMDEPTAVLPPNEVVRLFKIINEIKGTGTSVLYVSHRLDEIFELADRVSVIRGGEMIATEDIVSLTPRQLATLMVGEEIDPDIPTAGTGRPDAPVVLEARNLRARWLRGASFQLHRGEVLGLAGLLGSGREEVPYAIAGALGHEASGAVRILERSEEWLDITSGGFRLPLVPADRAREAVIAEFSVGENVTLSVLDRLRRRGAIDKRRELEVVNEWVGRLQVKTAGVDARISTLSGGNQQKVVMARCLSQESAVLLLCEPTAGVDIATRIALYDLIAREAERGLSFLVSSSDVGDLLATCTRVLVLRDGVVTRELGGGSLTRSALLHAMEGTDMN